MIGALLGAAVLTCSTASAQTAPGTSAPLPEAAVPSAVASPAPPVAESVPLLPPVRDGATNTHDVRAALEVWRKAWAERDLAAYIGIYAPDFRPDDGSTHAAWEKRRRDIIGRSSGVRIELIDVLVTQEAPDRASTRFVQRYQSANYRDAVNKLIEWQRMSGQWRIVRESSTPA